MKKLLLVAGLGAAGAYLLDSKNGEARRRRLVTLLGDGREATLGAGRQAAHAVEPLTPVPTNLMDRLDPGGARTAPAVIAKRVGAALLASIVVAAAGYSLRSWIGALARKATGRSRDRNGAAARGVVPAVGTLAPDAGSMPVQQTSPTMPLDPVGAVPQADNGHRPLAPASTV